MSIKTITEVHSGLWSVELTLDVGLVVCEAVDGWPACLGVDSCDVESLLVYWHEDETDDYHEATITEDIDTALAVLSWGFGSTIDREIESAARDAAEDAERALS